MKIKLPAPLNFSKGGGILDTFKHIKYMCLIYPRIF